MRGMAITPCSHSPQPHQGVAGLAGEGVASSSDTETSIYTTAPANIPSKPA